MDNEYAKMNEVLTTLGSKIENDMATKAEVKNFAELVNKMSEQNLIAAKKADKVPVFGDKYEAEQFLDVLKSAVVKTGLDKPEFKAFTTGHKTAGDALTTGGTNAGADLVPTWMSNQFSMLLAQGGVARRESTLYNNLQGNYDLPKRNGTSTAVFTAADDTAVTPTQLGTAKVTLSPKQVSAISLTANKLLFVSSIDLATNIAIDLVEQAGVLEDTSVLTGDGSATYGSITGIKTASGVGAVTLTAANYITGGSYILDALLTMTQQVHESVQLSKSGKFYLPIQTITALRTGKNATTGLYYFDVASGTYKIAGYDVEQWNRIGGAAATPVATNFVAVFGDFKKANVIGTGRDMSIDVDTSWKFGNNQTAFRLTYDFHSALIQAGALSRIVLT